MNVLRFKIYRVVIKVLGIPQSGTLLCFEMTLGPIYHLRAKLYKCIRNPINNDKKSKLFLEIGQIDAFTMFRCIRLQLLLP